MRLKKTNIRIGVFIAMAMIVGYIETLIPFSFGVPGIKLGLTNIVIVVALYSMNGKEAFIISMIRIVLVGFLFGNVWGILYSLSGGILSFLIMALLKRTHKFSLIGVSVVGGVFHNIGQVIVAALAVENFYVVFYLPALMIGGIITGILIGILAKEINLRLPKNCMN